VTPGLADANLCEGPAELVRQGTLELLDDLAERGVEAEPGAARDGQQVEGVRDHEQDRLLACLDLAAEPELGSDVAEDAADDRHQRPDHEREAEDAEDAKQEEEQDRPDDRADAL